MYALQTHPLSIIGNIAQENPFYRDPAEVLGELSGSETLGRLSASELSSRNLAGG